MNIIFLDIDGVLNTERWENLCLAGYASIEDEYGITFDDNSIARLQRIINTTGALIVIHSTWKLLHGVEWFEKMWRDRNLPGKIADITPNVPPYYYKQDEIANWLKQHPEVENYVILDDELEFQDQLSEHHVLIDGNHGITEEDARMAIHILSNRRLVL
ncbi:MAG: HAD domain-containing protein [[Clostridium] fimetarium]|nr:HAD domain-containing protein [Alistipes timonensis]MCM1405616.1 HAD domain-containing protein [[Clostridium] fimetarium]